MARPTDPAKLDDAIRLYEAGKTAREAEAATGISKSVLFRALHARGIATRRTLATPDGLIEDYLSGISVKACAAKYGIDRNAVYRMLREANIDGRNRSEAMQLRWSRASAEERSRMLDRAHEASKGVPAPEQTRVRIAQARAGQPLSPLETSMAAMLGQLGYEVELGVPCGPYNLDMVVSGTVTVEIFGGKWHEFGRHRARFAKRYRNLFDAGYSLVIVWVDTERYPLGVACAQHIATLVEITRGHPSIGRQHWVVRGDGYFLAVREDDGDEVPFITASGRRED